MRVKTSVTLPGDLLLDIDRHDANRSAFLERASRAYLVKLEKAKRDAADRAILDREADRLNAEAADVLDYQEPP